MAPLFCLQALEGSRIEFLKKKKKKKKKKRRYEA